MPPEDDDVTDEDSEDEEAILPKDPNHLGRGILSQEAEMVILEDDADDEPDAQPDDQPDNQPASQVKCEILPIPFIFFEWNLFLHKKDEEKIEVIFRVGHPFFSKERSVLCVLLRSL